VLTFFIKVFIQISTLFESETNLKYNIYCTFTSFSINLVCVMSLIHTHTHTHTHTHIYIYIYIYRERERERERESHMMKSHGSVNVCLQLGS
jgi:hypothetical protein